MEEKIEIVYCSWVNKATKENKTTIDLPRTIQKFLKKKGSSIILEGPTKKEGPFNYSVLADDKGRGYQIGEEFNLDLENEDSIFDEFYFLLLQNNGLHRIRAKIYDLERLLTIVYSWVEEKYAVEEMKRLFDEVEVCKEIEGLAKNKLKVWNEIKSFGFSSPTYYGSRTWNDYYLDMIDKLAHHPKLSKYFPFTSHYRIILTGEGRLHNWVYISPTKDGKYWLGDQNSEKPVVGKLFDTLDDAVDCWSELLTRMIKK